jgi:hypothetical protein
MSKARRKGELPTALQLALEETQEDRLIRGLASYHASDLTDRGRKILEAINALDPEEQHPVRWMVLRDWWEGLKDSAARLERDMRRHLTDRVIEAIVGIGKASEEIREALARQRNCERAKTERTRERLDTIRKAVVGLKMTDEQIIKHLREDHRELIQMGKKGKREVRESTILRDIRRVRDAVARNCNPAP